MNAETIHLSSSSDRVGALTLVLGGVRSGKSRFAQDLAAKLAGDDVLFVATAESHDGEMQHRIEHHQRSRPSTWKTLEQPLETAIAIAQWINESKHEPGVVIIDCLTLLVSNLLCRPESESLSMDVLESQVLEESDALIHLANCFETDVVIVSGEVGSGVVPEHPLGRRFRDLLGLANQRLAASADATYWMVAGLAINATTLATSVAEAAAQTPSRQEHQHES
ncbi:bifunctional adenosylcobinamide kinase/adenosylcobinamide-phosphate guanylyltransferase [Stieleria sp. TO1_6]|uniref:bifunctional adenosylcobinamide kinase/adenosylcobinamide-phosphate guanylyltransferase n=1 Tax=Stieleria tagensis TaxID=2956795 RepID=UPI00209B80AD|nr:bifunctional adenosylcobinamide kinase/adenosylcobinamide-phosphate guanylyltransferase [Stieleria tagensis]MCO8121055.1 bifunctional adenosylcobinamide kinase/adenosylcobinamide-phosphate guanylyltransferase [Stieleria tagensis]